MIDKLNNINAGNTQNKRAVDDSKTKEINIKSSEKSDNNSQKSSNNVEISSELNVKDMSAEAPIVVVKELENRDFCGGASIVASHISNLGAKCKLISVVGDDDNGKYITEKSWR